MLSVCIKVVARISECMCVLFVCQDHYSLMAVKVDGNEGSLKDICICQPGYCCTIIVISIQLLFLTLCTKPQNPFFHPQKKAFILLLLKLQYIDEVIDSLSLLSPKISEG